MHKTKKEIKKIDGRIVITNGKTTLEGFKNWNAARKFLTNFCDSKKLLFLKQKKWT